MLRSSLAVGVCVAVFAVADTRYHAHGCFGGTVPGIGLPLDNVLVASALLPFFLVALLGRRAQPRVVVWTMVALTIVAAVADWLIGSSMPGLPAYCPT